MTITATLNPKVPVKNVLQHCLGASNYCIANSQHDVADRFNPAENVSSHAPICQNGKGKASCSRNISRKKMEHNNWKSTGET